MERRLFTRRLFTRRYFIRRCYTLAIISSVTGFPTGSMKCKQCDLYIRHFQAQTPLGQRLKEPASIQHCRKSAFKSSLQSVEPSHACPLSVAEDWSHSRTPHCEAGIHQLLRKHQKSQRPQFLDVPCDGCCPICRS